MSLKKESSQAQYINECIAVVNKIDKLSTAEMQNVLINAVNKQLRMAGVPEVTSSEDISSDSNAVFDFQKWEIVFGSPLIGSSTLTSFRLGVNTVYHEARHCEQWYCMIQGVAAGILNKEVRHRIDSSDAGAIAAGLWVPQNIVARAMQNSNYQPNSDKEVLAWWNSVYASQGGIRGRKLAHINERYDAYRHLPEEVDAWALGDGVEEKFAAQCPKTGCPTYKHWKKETYLFWYRRSPNLVSIDKALEAYEKSKSSDDRSKLKKAFDLWYKIKTDSGGTKRAKGSNDAVSQLKSFLDKYGSGGIPMQGVRVLPLI